MTHIANTGFVAVAIAIGCAMTPMHAHDGMGPRRGPLWAVREVLRCRSEVRRIECVAPWIKSGEPPSTPPAPPLYRT